MKAKYYLKLRTSFVFSQSLLTRALQQGRYSTAFVFRHQPTSTMGSSSFPSTMRTLLQPSAISTDLILTTHPLPTATPNTSEHLIRVRAFAPCAGELLWPKNFPSFLNIPSPARKLIPCYDFSGIVATAPSSSPFQPGTEVYARTSPGRTGIASEYGIAVTDELAAKPRGLGWEEAASMPMSAETAWQALFVHAGLEEIDSADVGRNAKKRVLVTGASGGVGLWVVQLAKLAGCEVVGTCGPDSIESVKSYGAVDAVNYRTTSLKSWVEEDKSRMFDVVIDCVGKSSLEDAWWAVKDNGTLISICQPPESSKPEGLEKEGVRNAFIIMVPNGEQLKKISGLWEEGKVRPVVDSVFKVEDFENGFKRVASGHAKGKVIITLGE
jgi:NADPH:quinone reductase-like Zn-dependent oxidoreductase